jgi:uncharacterized repeat protein (TIGR03847 family)
MPRRLFIFDPPDRFVSGAVGLPGSRAFFLQARKGRAVVSVALEKAQVAALAERLEELLTVIDDDPSANPPAASRPAASPPAATQGGPGAPAEDLPLDEPVVEVFRVGAMALSWDATAERVVIEAQPQDESGGYVEADDQDEDGPDLMRVRIAPNHARAFVEHAQVLVAAGRPPCPFCGQPLEATGHFCLAANGQQN